MFKSKPRLAETKCSSRFAFLILLSSFCACPLTHADSFFVPDPWYGTSFEASTDELIENCPQPLEKLSAKCTSTVDDYFEDSLLEGTDTWWISVPNRLTYGRAFKNPRDDRERVLQALKKKECRLEEGKDVRWDLAEPCNADAFANLSLFLWACSEHGNSDKPLNYSVDMSDLADVQNSKPEFYKRQLHNRIVTTLEAHWLSNKCAKYDVSKMWFDLVRNPEQHKVLFASAKRLGEMWWYKDASETYILKSLAARLGDISTAMVYSGPSSPQAGSWNPYTNKAWAWINDAKIFGGRSLDKTSYDPFDVRKRLQMGVSLAVSLQELGLNFDWNFLVKKVCTLTDLEAATCKSAIEDLKPTLDLDKESELAALEKFESVSQQLGL